MTGERPRTKGAGAWGQSFMAVGLVTVLGVGMWALQDGSPPDSVLPPATCPGEDSEKVSEGAGTTLRRVPGARLCTALNRPELAELLGTPGETATTASGGDGSFTPAGGKEIATPSARVEFATYTVTLSATYDGLPVAGSADLLGESARRRMVLGRPAVSYAKSTISIGFRVDGSDASGGPGLPAAGLMVAQDRKDSGGSFEVVLWRADGIVPDDAVLLRVAEKVLPTVPGWDA